jgi:hypothetical protein
MDLTTPKHKAMMTAKKVYSLQTVCQCLLLPLVYVGQTTNIAAGIDERKRHETEDECDFICDRKGINSGRGEGKQGRKRDERKDGVSKSHSSGENIKQRKSNKIRFNRKIKSV